MNGIIVVNKQRGMTSHDVVARARKLLGTQKIGHTGTLDPEATGVLILCIGKATKLSRFIMATQKEYLAAMILGIRTDTQDHAGKIISKLDCDETSRERLEEVLNGFRGEISQVPPMVSAVRHHGKKLYEIARKGNEVQREPRKVIIHGIELLSYEHPVIRFRVVCSKGTYIRTLCSDIGDTLGCGAHQSELTRTRSGPFDINSAVLLEELEKSDRSENLIMPVEEALSFLPAVTIRGWVGKFVSKSLSVKGPDLLSDLPLSSGDIVRILNSGGRLLAIGRVRPPASDGEPAVEIVHCI